MKQSNVNAINDVRRKINEVMKKHDDRVVVGWRPSFVKREEGDEWVDENGKEWIKKDGLVQSKSKLQSARMPLFCPSCEKIMNHRFDTKFWRLRGMCMDCVTKEETQLRYEGKYSEYAQEKIKKNYRASLVDRIDELKDLHRTIKSPEVLLADDTNILMKETWNVDIDQVKEDISKDIEFLENLLERFDNGELDDHFEREL